jgi:hypothetical protein
MLRRVALLRTDVLEELNASFIRVTRIGELGTKLAVTSNRRTLRRNLYFLRATRRNIPEDTTLQLESMFVIGKTNIMLTKRIRLEKDLNCGSVGSES